MTHWQRALVVFLVIPAGLFFILCVSMWINRQLPRPPQWWDVWLGGAIVCILLGVLAWKLTE